MATATSFMKGSSMRTAPFTGVKSSVSRVRLTVEANKKVQKKTKVILTKDLANVGTAGEMLSVPVGYYRNFLLPRSLAEVASDAILQRIRKQKEDEIRGKLEVKAQAQAFANALATIGKFTLKKKAGDKDQIFGSVQAAEVAEAIYQQTGRSVAEADLEVPDIKTVGTYECRVKLHPEVTGVFSVVIAKEKNVATKKK